MHPARAIFSRPARALIATVLVLAPVGAYGAVQATVQDGAIRLDTGKASLSLAAAKGTVAVQSEGFTLEGKGSAVLLSAAGKATPLKDAAKADGTVDLGEAVAAAALFEPVVGTQAQTLALLDLRGQGRSVSVPLAAVGLDTSAVYATYDFNSNRFNGPVSNALGLAPPTNRFAVVNLAKAGAAPVLLSTSQMGVGKPEVSDLAWEAGKRVLRGTSVVAAAGSYQLRLFAPPEPKRLVTDSASVSGAGVTTKVFQTGPWVRVYLKCEKPQTVKWEVPFAEAAPVQSKATNVALAAEAVSPRAVQIKCAAGGQSILLRRSDGAQFLVSSPWFKDTTVQPDTEYTYTAYALSWTGEGAKLATASAKTLPLPPRPPKPTVYLADLTPLRTTNGWNGDPRRNLSIEDNPLTVRGEVFEHGIGVHAVAELVYAATPERKRFVALVGVDDEKNDSPSGSVTFAVYADDKELFKSAVLTPNDELVGIDVALPAGAKEIRLVVGDGGNGVGCDHADWVDAGFVTAQ